MPCIEGEFAGLGGQERSVGVVRSKKMSGDGKGGCENGQDEYGEGIRVCKKKCMVHELALDRELITVTIVGVDASVRGLVKVEQCAKASLILPFN